MPLDKRGQELHRGDEVSIRMRVIDVVADSDRANLLLVFDAPVPGFPEEWRFQIPSDRVELEVTSHRELKQTPVPEPSAAVAGSPQP